MKAVVLREHGGPEVLHLEEVPAPEMSPGDVLARVRACALNNVDLQLQGEDVGVLAGAVRSRARNLSAPARSAHRPPCRGRPI